MLTRKKTMTYEQYCGTTPNYDGYLGKWDKPKMKYIALQPENYHYFRYLSEIYDENETFIFNHMLAEFVKSQRILCGDVETN